MVEITISYEGDLHCQAQHGPSGRTLETDAPKDNQGRGESFSPTDLVATALGTCMGTIIGIVAQRHQLDLRGTKITVQKEMTSSPPRRIGRLTTEIHLPIPANHPQRALLESAALGCPVHHSLHPDIEKPVTFHYEG